MRVYYHLYPYFWAAGLKYVFFMLYPLLKLRHIAGSIKRFHTENSATSSVLWFFLLYQITSTFISSFTSDISYIRLAAIFHNYLVFLFFIMALSVSSISKLKFGNWIIIYLNISLCLYVLSIFYGELSWIGLFEKVAVVETGYLTSGSIPRLSIFSDYYNATAIILLGVLYLFIIQKDKSFSRIKVSYIFMLVMMLMLATGSRIGVVLCLATLPLFLTRSPFFLVLLYVTAIIITLISAEVIFNYADSLRESSSNTRKFIYDYSINLTNNHNPFTGLGFKPKYEWMRYPVGSHSTFIGYYVKNGVIGLFLWLVIILMFYYRALYCFIHSCNRERYYAIVNIIFLSIYVIIFVFEDLDAFELNAVFFGIVVGNIYKKRLSCPKN